MCRGFCVSGKLLLLFPTVFFPTPTLPSYYKLQEGAEHFSPFSLLHDSAPRRSHVKMRFVFIMGAEAKGSVHCCHLLLLLLLQLDLECRLQSRAAQCSEHKGGTAASLLLLLGNERVTGGEERQEGERGERGGKTWCYWCLPLCNSARFRVCSRTSKASSSPVGGSERGTGDSPSAAPGSSRLLSLRKQ